MRRYLIDVSARRQGTKILLRRQRHYRIIMPRLLPFANDRIGSVGGGRRLWTFAKQRLLACTGAHHGGV